MTTTWTQLKVGAGGLITGLSGASDGTIYCRTDTLGAYKWDGVSKWNQLCTTSSLDTASVLTGTANGVYEILPAPSNPSVLYMVYGAYTGAGESTVFVSGNAGATFATTPLTKLMDPSGNHGAARKYGPHGAVDPINPDVCYIATTNVGVYQTANGTLGASSTWTQISTATIPANDTQYMGCVAFDSSGGATGGKTNNIYASVSGGGLYKSTDAGGAWALVANMPATTSIKRIKVASDGTIYLNTFTSTAAADASGRIYKLTFPAGVPTWADISGPIVSSGGAIEGIVLDLTTSGATQKIVAFSYGSGFQYSTDAGGSWSHTTWIYSVTGTYTLALGSMTFTIASGQSASVIAGQGIFIADGAATGSPPGSGNAKSWGRGTVTAYNNATGALTVNMIAINGVLGAYSGYFIRNQGYGCPSSSSPNAPWLLTLGPAIGTLADVGMIDAVLEPISGKIFGAGIQTPVQLSYPPVTDGTWAATNVSNGVEQLSSKMIVCPPGGSPIACVEDVGFLKVSSIGTAPSIVPYPGGTAAGSLDCFLCEGWAADWSASTPTFLAGLIDSFNIGNFICKSSDGGTSWALCAGSPTNVNSMKNIAVSDTNNFVVIPNNSAGASPAYTLDGGSTWTTVSTLGGQTPNGGWGAGTFSPGSQITADRVAANTFYIYNDGSGSGGGQGIYKSTDGGASWTYTAKNLGIGYIWLKAAPMVSGGINTTGHLFANIINYSGGAWSGPTTTFKFSRSIDGGANWTAVLDPVSGFPAIAEVWAFGFGAPAPGGTYPSVVINGFYNSGSGWVRGTYRSTDNCTTWQKIGEAYPDGWPDTIVDLNGDMSTYGTYYVTKGGSSFLVGQDLLISSNTSGFSVIHGRGGRHTKMIGY